MTSTRTIRHHQIKIGVVTHDGHKYAALGATVVRRDLTGYVKFKRGRFWLTTWSGGTMLDCRSEVVERYWHGGLALMFRLPKGKFIVGYALGENGLLFRGELIDRCTEDEARRPCRMVANNWMDLDGEDEEAELEAA